MPTIRGGGCPAAVVAVLTMSLFLAGCGPAWLAVEDGLSGVAYRVRYGPTDGVRGQSPVTSGGVVVAVPGERVRELAADPTGNRAQDRSVELFYALRDLAPEAMSGAVVAPLDEQGRFALATEAGEYALCLLPEDAGFAGCAETYLLPAEGRVRLVAAMDLRVSLTDDRGQPYPEP